VPVLTRSLADAKVSVRQRLTFCDQISSLSKSCYSHIRQLREYRCVNDVADWMQSNRLQLNPGKTELLWCTTSRRQNRLPTSTLTVGSSTVSPVSSVRDLGIFVDSDLVMRTHVCQTVSRCFSALRQLRSIRHLVSATVFQSLVAALVLSQLD